MREIITRENFIFVGFFSFIATTLLIIAFSIFNHQFSQSYSQYEHIYSIDAKFVFSTNRKMSKNSYMSFDNHKSFYIDEELNSRIQVNSLMQLDVFYDSSALISGKHVINGSFTELQLNEVIITNETAQSYNLRLNDLIYSKNRINQSVHSFRVAGIINDVYTTDRYTYNQSKGILIFGFNPEEETQFGISFINFSSTDPSEELIKNGVSLQRLYNIDDLIYSAKIITYSFIFLHSIIIIIVFSIAYILLLKDSNHYFVRLKRIGALNTLTKLIILRATIFVLISIVLFVFFTVINNYLTLILVKPIIYWLIVILGSSVIFCISFIERLIK